MRATCISSLLIALAIGTYAQVPTPKSAAEAEVLAALAERDKAFVVGDEKAVARFMADDYLQTDVVGHVQDKATWLKEYFEPLSANIKSGEFHWEAFQRTDLQVRDFGYVAVVIGVQSYKGKMHLAGKNLQPSKQGKDRPPHEIRFTQVWVKRDGGWKLAVVHNMDLPNKDKN